MDGHGTEGWRGKKKEEKKEREEREEQEGCHFYGRQKQLLCENYSVQLLCVFVCLWMGGGGEVDTGQKWGREGSDRHEGMVILAWWDADS